MFIGPQPGATEANNVLSDYTKQEYQHSTTKTHILREVKVKRSRLGNGGNSWMVNRTDFDSCFDSRFFILLLIPDFFLPVLNLDLFIPDFCF